MITGNQIDDLIYTIPDASVNLLIQNLQTLDRQKQRFHSVDQLIDTLIYHRENQSSSTEQAGAASDNNEAPSIVPYEGIIQYLSSPGCHLLSYIASTQGLSIRTVELDDL